MSDLRKRIADTIRRAYADEPETSAAGLSLAIADDLENMPALLAFALRDAFTETELAAIRIVIERHEFRDMNHMRRLHAAVIDAIYGEA